MVQDRCERARELFARKLKLLTCCCLLEGCYALKQVYHQGNLLSERRHISAVLADSEIDSQTKKGLVLVRRIRDYAKSEGLNVGGAYNYYIATDREVVSYLVQAAPEFELKLKRWSFPIVGSVPYLGYYNKENRDHMAAELRGEGYDVSLGGASAFSSLGWFDDPIFSSMLDRSEARLAHLLFHELVHRSFWLPGNAKFNENLAEAIAQRMTLAYLDDRGLVDELNEYVLYRGDRVLFRDWVNRLRAALKKLYRSNHNSDEKRREKRALFSRYASEEAPKFRTDYYANLNKIRWNNAKLMGSTLYAPDQDAFDKYWTCLGASKAGQFLEKLSQIKDLDKLGRNALDRHCARE